MQNIHHVLLLKKLKKNDRFLYKLICQYGVLGNVFEVGQFVNFKDACPNELKQMDVDNLKTIILIEVSMFYSCGSTTEHM